MESTEKIIFLCIWNFSLWGEALQKLVYKKIIQLLSWFMFVFPKKFQLSFELTQFGLFFWFLHGYFCWNNFQYKFYPPKVNTSLTWLQQFYSGEILLCQGGVELLKLGAIPRNENIPALSKLKIQEIIWFEDEHLVCYHHIPRD